MNANKVGIYKHKEVVKEELKGPQAILDFYNMVSSGVCMGAGVKLGEVYSILVKENFKGVSVEDLSKLEATMKHFGEPDEAQVVLNRVRQLQESKPSSLELGLLREIASINSIISKLKSSNAIPIVTAETNIEFRNNYLRF